MKENYNQENMGQSDKQNEDKWIYADVSPCKKEDILCRFDIITDDNNGRDEKPTHARIIGSRNDLCVQLYGAAMASEQVMDIIMTVSNRINMEKLSNLMKDGNIVIPEEIKDKLKILGIFKKDGENTDNNDNQDITQENDIKSKEDKIKDLLKGLLG